MKTLIIPGLITVSVFAITFSIQIVRSVPESPGISIQEDTEVTEEIYDLIFELSTTCEMTEDLEIYIRDGKITMSEAGSIADMCEESAEPPSNPFSQGMDDERQQYKNNGGVRI